MTAYSGRIRPTLTTELSLRPLHCACACARTDQPPHRPRPSRHHGHHHSLTPHGQPEPTAARETSVDQQQYRRSTKRACWKIPSKSYSLQIEREGVGLLTTHFLLSEKHIHNNRVPVAASVVQGANNNTDELSGTVGVAPTHADEVEGFVRGSGSCHVHCSEHSVVGYRKSEAHHRRKGSSGSSSSSSSSR